MSETDLKSKGLHHLAFTTRDVEATYEFYAKQLGMRLLHTETTKFGRGYFRHFFFAMGAGQSIAFFQVENVGEKADYKTEISSGLGLPPWANHVAFKLETLDELTEMKAQMTTRGIENILQVDHGWAQSIYTLDPNGIMVEFCVTTDAAAFEQSEEEALRLMRLPAAEILAQAPA